MVPQHDSRWHQTNALSIDSTQTLSVINFFQNNILYMSLVI